MNTRTTHQTLVQPINKLNSNVKLYDALKASYSDKGQQQKTMSQSGYVRDNKLSNSNEQVYFNPSQKKLLYSVAVTHNAADWGTDVALAFGHLKDTNRYREARDTLATAKTKYRTNATVIGHSLGSTIGSYIAGPNDTFVGYNGGFTIGQKTYKNATNLRTRGDLVSLLGARTTGVHTFANKNKSSNIVSNVLSAHNLENLKGSAIFV